METIDNRALYGEERWIAMGLIGIRVHIMIYTRRAGNIRIISLRKANSREMEHYGKS